MLFRTRIPRTTLGWSQASLLGLAFPIRHENLGELGLFANFRAIPVEDIYWDYETNGEESEKSGWPFEGR